MRRARLKKLEEKRGEPRRRENSNVNLGKGEEGSVRFVSGDMAETEKKYTTAYGKLRRLTSTIDGQIRQISVSDSRGFRFHFGFRIASFEVVASDGV